MNSFISSSKYTATFVGIFILLLMLSHVATRSSPMAAVTANIPSGDDYYLANYHGGVEHYMIYRGLSGIPAYLKNADVLFLGDSRMQFGWPRQTLEPFFSKRNMTWYQLGFGYSEPSPFALDIIRKYDLHPQWVVINVDPFFTRRPSEMAEKVLASSKFDAFKFRLETVCAFYGQRWIHTIVPAMNDQSPRGDEVYFRSIKDGNVLMAASANLHTLVPAQTWGEVNWFKNLDVAQEFKAELDRRGTRMVFTVDPLPSPKNALGLAACLNDVPVLIPTVPRNQLYTYDGRHLEPESAAKYSQDFLNQFDKLLKTSSTVRAQN